MVRKNSLHMAKNPLHFVHLLLVDAYFNEPPLQRHITLNSRLLCHHCDCQFYYVLCRFNLFQLEKSSAQSQDKREMQLLVRQIRHQIWKQKPHSEADILLLLCWDHVWNFGLQRKHGPQSRFHATQPSTNSDSRNSPIHCCGSNSGSSEP